MAAVPAGQYDRLIEIWRTTPGADNALGESTAVPVLFNKFWAARGFMSADEKERAAQVGAVETLKYRLRYNTASASISTTDQLRVGARIYNVNAVQEVGFHENVDVTCTAVVP